MDPTSALRVLRASQVSPRAAGEPPWLVQGLWGAGACGVLGGAPKSGKSWLTLEMAVAVASGRPCLGRFTTALSGPVLIYAPEDAPVQVRERLEGLSILRGVAFQDLDVHLILEPRLRIDCEEDLGRLESTLGRLRPRLLVLDPYVRLQRADENNSSEVSQVLGSLRELSRAHSVGVLLVHHTRKGGSGQAGRALRGSSDFHAWGDSNLYLSREGEDLKLQVEHRAAPSGPGLRLRLVADRGPAHLEVQGERPAEPENGCRPLPERVLEALDVAKPLRNGDLRAALRVRNERLTQVLEDLRRRNRVLRRPEGWVLNSPR